MSVLPESREKRLQYFEARWNLWLTNASSLGVSAAQINGLKSLVMDDREAFEAAQLARANAKSATSTWYNSNNAMVSMGRDLIKTIKAFAETSGNPNVYNLANIDAPLPPTPIPAPTTPTSMNGFVSADGVVTLTWKADKSGPSSGIFFSIERKRGSGNYIPMGATMSKSFVDGDAGITTAPVQYRVRAIRGDKMSEYTLPVIFNFVSGSGFVVSGNADAGPEMKMAA